MLTNLILAVRDAHEARMKRFYRLLSTLIFLSLTMAIVTCQRNTAPTTEQHDATPPQRTRTSDDSCFAAPSCSFTTNCDPLSGKINNTDIRHACLMACENNEEICMKRKGATSGIVWCSFFPCQQSHILICNWDPAAVNCGCELGGTDCFSASTCCPSGYTKDNNGECCPVK